MFVTTRDQAQKANKAFFFLFSFFFLVVEIMSISQRKIVAYQKPNGIDGFRRLLLPCLLFVRDEEVVNWGMVGR